MKTTKAALIVVDVQNDFLPGGPMGVNSGDEIVPVVNRLMEDWPLVVATQDWHPPDHGSFVENHPGREVFQEVDLNGLPQILWPTHCVQGSEGAELSPGLDRIRIAKVFPKGEEPEIDSYSGFFDNGRRRSTGLADWLQEQRVEEVAVCGLATDYCVKFTALDAVQEGFRTRLILSATRGVDLQPGDVDRAVAEMRAAGVGIV